MTDSPRDMLKEVFVVAITRWARPIDEELEALAPLIGQTGYELRMRLTGPLPVPVKLTPVADEARELLGSLRARGHGAVACDTARIGSSDTIARPRDFAFEDAAFVSSAPTGSSWTVPYTEILALVRATHRTVEDSSSSRTARKLSVGRAVLTGGLAVSKKTTSSSRHIDDQRTQVLYVFRKSGDGTLLLGEAQVRYGGLGSGVARTRLENFRTLVARLRERAPAALFDERLVSQPRRASLSGVSGTSANRTVVTSNESEMDLAAHLIAVAHLHDQLG